MIHDMITDLEFYKTNLDNMPQQQAGRELYQRTLLYTVGVKPHVFYFNRDHIDQEIVTTGHDFYKQGALDFPFDNCCFVFDNAIDEADKSPWLTKNRRELYLLQRISAIKNPLLKDQVEMTLRNWLDADYIFQKFTEIQGGNVFKGPFPVPDSYLASLGSCRDWAQYGKCATLNLLPADCYSPETKEVAGINYQFATGTLIGALMLLSTKYAQKAEHHIDRKLNERRQKNGKGALLGYTVVSLGKQFSQAGDGSHASPPKPPKPHWRRGHMRHLASGKATKVMPCIVNWDGKEPEEKIYKINAETPLTS